MSRLTVLSLILVLLCPVTLFAAQKKSDGSDDSTRAQATKQAPALTPKPDPHPVSTTPAPYVRPQGGNGGGASNHPSGGRPQYQYQGTAPNRPGSFSPRPSGSNVSPQPYRRDDGRGQQFSYPSPNRAYSYPDRRDWGGRDNWGGRRDRDDHSWYGGWSTGPSWGLGFGYGYINPYPSQVVVPYPYPVPGPTVYYPTPVETAPEYYPQSVPAQGAPAVAPQDLPLLGCDIIAGDGTFLGVIDREYQSPQSIANRTSDFGNPGGRVSIWNPQSPYGSPTGQYSPWNPQAATPPMLSWHGAFKAYLTMNPAIQPAISPEVLPELLRASPWR